MPILCDNGFLIADIGTQLDQHQGDVDLFLIFPTKSECNEFECARMSEHIAPGQEKNDGRSVLCGCADIADPRDN